MMSSVLLGTLGKVHVPLWLGRSLFQASSGLTLVLVPSNVTDTKVRRFPAFQTVDLHLFAMADVPPTSIELAQVVGIAGSAFLSGMLRPLHLQFSF